MGAVPLLCREWSDWPRFRNLPPLTGLYQPNKPWNGGWQPQVVEDGTALKGAIDMLNELAKARFILLAGQKNF